MSDKPKWFMAWNGTYRTWDTDEEMRYAIDLMMKYRPDQKLHIYAVSDEMTGEEWLKRFGAETESEDKQP